MGERRDDPAHAVKQLIAALALWTATVFLLGLALLAGYLLGARRREPERPPQPRLVGLRRARRIGFRR